MPVSKIPGVVGEYSMPLAHYSVYNYRSEKHIPNARKTDGYGYFPPCDTDDEFEMEARFDAKKKHLPNRNLFLQAVRDYMVSHLTRNNAVFTYLRDNIPRFSVPVQGGRTYYRGQKINQKTLESMLNQKMKDPSNEAFSHGLVHGFRKQDNPSPEHPGLPFTYKGEEYTHHGVSSISSMYWQGKKAALIGRVPEVLKAQGDIPLLLELETTKAKPFRAIAPRYNFYPIKFLKPHPSSEHELLLDADNNTYRLSRVIYDDRHKMWVAKMWASAEPVEGNGKPAAPTKPANPEPPVTKEKSTAPQQNAAKSAGQSNAQTQPEQQPKTSPKAKPGTHPEKPPGNASTEGTASSAKPNPFTEPRRNKLKPTDIHINPKITSPEEKLACWNQIFNALKTHPDYRMAFDSAGKLWLDTEPPRFNKLTTFDPDYNELGRAASRRDRHIKRYSKPPFVVVTDQRHTTDKPHLLILPTPIRTGNYQDLRDFLQRAPERQKIALWDTMAALIIGTKKMPQTDTLFKTNGGKWQSIPYFSIHYMPYGQN